MIPGRRTARASPSGARSLLLSAFLAACGGGPTGYVGADPPIAYWEIGHAAGPTVIVLHGGPGATHAYLRPEWDALANDRRVIFYDQRGCGRSGRADAYRLGDHVADLRALIGALSPEGPVVIAGISWGATLALLYAREHPEDVVALVLTGLPPFGLLAPWPSGIAAHENDVRAGGNGTREAGEVMSREEAPVRGRRERRSEPPSPLDPNRAGVDRAYVDRVEMCEEPQWYTFESLRELQGPDAFHDVAVPALLFHGALEEGSYAGAPLAHGILPGSELQVIEGAAHSPWYNRPALFFCEVEAFLDRVASDRSGATRERGRTARGPCADPHAPREARVGLVAALATRDANATAGPLELPDRLRPLWPQEVSDQDLRIRRIYAREGIDAWLALLDEGRYRESWEQAGGEARAAVGVDEWEAEMRQAREALGALQSRQRRTYRFQHGGLVQEFRSVFARDRDGRRQVSVVLEQVTLAPGAEGGLAAVGYLVTPTPW